MSDGDEGGLCFGCESELEFGYEETLTGERYCSRECIDESLESARADSLT